MGPVVCLPKIPITPGKLSRNLELAIPLGKHAKGHDTEPGCQLYYWFVPENGNQEFLYGIEIYESEKAMEEHNSSPVAQEFVKHAIAEQLGSGPPDLRGATLLGGWSHRPNEPKRCIPHQRLIFTTLTLNPTKLSQLLSSLPKKFDALRNEHKGLMSCLVMQDKQSEGRLYVFERFACQADLDGRDARGVLGECVEGSVVCRDEMLVEEVMGFLDKGE